MFTFFEAKYWTLFELLVYWFWVTLEALSPPTFCKHHFKIFLGFGGVISLQTISIPSKGHDKSIWYKESWP